VAAGDYGVAVTFTLPLFNNQNSALEYVVLDDTAPATCSATVALTSPTTCSPNGPDLQVSALQLDPTGIQANGDLEFTFDLTNAGATSNAVPFTVPQPAGCEIAINNVLGITCSDNGTPSDPTDDQASVQLVVNNGSVVGAYDILDPSGSTIGGGVYGSTASMVIQNLQATQGATIQYTLVDRNDPTCTSQFPIITPVPCSNGGAGDIDLSVGITQSPGQPAQYTLYSVTATVSNSGAQSATGVVVDLPLPAGVVYEGGNEYSATQGDLRIFGSNVGTWTVGTIAAGQTAEITINYFLRVTSSPNSYIEVLAANEQDVDSTPGNGNGQVTEDDEASTDPTSGPTCSISASIQSIDCDDQGTATETDDTYSVTFLVENGAATGTWTADNGGANPSFGGSYGVPYTLQGGNLLNAINLGGLTLAVNITDDLDASCTTSLTWQTPGATCSSSTDPCDAVTEYRATPAAPFKVGVSDDEAGNFTVQYATPSGGLASFTFNVPSAIGISPVNLSTVSARDVICTSNGFAVAGLYRELGSPGNNQPYVILLDAAGAVTHSNVAPFAGTYNDINNLGFLDVATSGPAGDIVYVEAFTAGRSYQIAAFDASATLLWEGQRIGDLVTNRIEGAVLSDDESRIYFSYRDGNSITWPRLRGVNVTDGSTDWEVRLGDLTNLPLNEPVRGDVSAPFLTENDEVIVSFSASGLNSNVQRHAARFDAAGNLVYFTQQPDPASNSFDIYTPVFESSTGAVVFSGTPATVVLTASGEAVLCNNDQIDLELTAVSSTQQPQQYTTNSITFTLTNDGPSTATGILVDVIKPSEVVYTGGNEFTASQGTYAPRANPDVWDVGSLAAGESATLVVNYFVREAGGFLQRAEVSAADQVDVDSTPGNASGVLEDDEVILNLNFASTQALTFFPNPLPQGEQIILDFVSSGETSQTMIFSDLTGRPVHTVQVAFQEGRNRIPVDLGSLPSGIYVVAFPESGLAPKRIIVQE